MQKILNRALIFAFALFALNLSTPVSLAQTLGDRLILDINGLHYSQRQLESYLLVRSMLLSGGQSGGEFSADNWSANLQVFEQMMLIEQEAFRLGGFQPSEVMIKTAMEVIQKKLTDGAAESQQARRLGLDTKTTRRIAAAILRAEAMRRSRQRSALEADAVVKRKANTSSEDDWLADLKRWAVIRRYNGADRFIAIEPAR